MKFVGAKTSEIVLDGIGIETEHRDGQIFSLTFTDSNGHILKVSKNNYSELAVYVPAPPKTEKKFELSMSLHGLADVRQVFDHEFEATTRKNEIEKQFGYPEFKSEIKEIEVPVAD